ncbi:fibronectin type III domain-containing protein [Arthrobacter sp. 2MCAF14]|uniref:fibronectin type III domain-containing protein n=1 Tax=Arthrobacter sp. 2MCAF14 TaxID=3232982 RepID=UPI003F8E8F0D
MTTTIASMAATGIIGMGAGLMPPGSPGAPTAVDGVSSASLSVSPPSSGGAVDSYTVTANPDGATCTITGASGSCVVRGLINGYTYSFTATATNSAGTSQPSPPSNSVTLHLTPIDIYYFSLGGPAFLGDPTGWEVDNLRFGGAYRNYSRGTIYWSPTTYSHLNQGAIRSAYAAQGWENGPLGYPTSDEVGPIRGGGVYQSFQGGAIYWSPATGAHVNAGAIRSAYVAQGSENGLLGYPTSNEVKGLRYGGAYQSFQGGAIYWSPATGAHVNAGAIRSAYAAQGWENGLLGYPTGNEVKGLRDGGAYQSFQGGAIYWSPATGAHVNKGAIRDAYAAQGWENGELGYPTSNEYSVCCGGAAQDFQGGRITWTPTGGTSITRR